MHPILKFALKQAQKNEYDSNIGFKLCAVITRGNNVISVGFNEISRNSYVNYISRYDNSPKPFLNKHAEISAILQARSKTDLTGCKIFVSRLKPSGGFGMARPCACCQISLYRYGIKRAYYSIDNDSYGVLNISEKSDVIHNFNLLEAV